MGQYWRTLFLRLVGYSLLMFLSHPLLLPLPPTPTLFCSAPTLSRSHALLLPCLPAFAAQKLRQQLKRLKDYLFTCKDQEMVEQFKQRWGMAMFEHAVKQVPCEQKQSVRTKSVGHYWFPHKWKEYSLLPTKDWKLQFGNGNGNGNGNGDGMGMGGME